MPKWAWGMIAVLFVIVFVLPAPAHAGEEIGNIIQSLIIFLRSFGHAVMT